MMDPTFKLKVPQPVREFAEKSVDQAEKAISSFMQTAGNSMATVPGPMTDVAKQALAITEANLKASFDHARKLMQANDISEVMQLQSEFLQAQFGAATERLLAHRQGNHDDVGSGSEIAQHPVGLATDDL